MKRKFSKVGSKLNTNLDKIKETLAQEKEDKKEANNKNRQNSQRSVQNRVNITYLMRALEKQFQTRDWVHEYQKSEDQAVSQIRVEQAIIKNAIENFLYLDQKLNKERKDHLSEDDLKEILPQIMDIIK